MRMRALSVTLFCFTILAASAVQAEPVHYKQLISMLTVSLPGWTPGEPTGQTVRSPLEASEATQEFTKGESRIEVAVFDGGPAMGAAMGAVSQVEMESPEQTVKPLTLKGFKGAVYTYPKENEADLVLMVPPRFAVTVHSSGTTDVDLLKKVAEQLDLSKLAAAGK
ncbi:hypothetical protein [Fundidesulfovibrio agrisoli]|uniref:hypothetical protein n=1 Tax=Fundidesulfovibrio agrisoli TaxID=2922717 RepID=UPI001FAC2F78|nr:hypothetical protein [Fundidesulfovibrio agrisoli]